MQIQLRKATHLLMINWDYSTPKRSPINNSNTWHSCISSESSKCSAFISICNPYNNKVHSCKMSGLSPIHLSSTGALAMQPWRKGTSIPIPWGSLCDCLPITGHRAYPIGTSAPPLENWIELGPQSLDSTWEAMGTAYLHLWKRRDSNQGLPDS